MIWESCDLVIGLRIGLSKGPTAEDAKDAEESNSEFGMREVSVIPNSKFSILNS